MSINLMSRVWKLPMPTTQKMVLLIMCDYGNDDGLSVYPSIRKVAERASLSERHAQRVVHSLINEGWISVIGNANGGAPGTTRNYQINVQKLDETGDIGVTGDKMSRVTWASPLRVTSDTQTGDMGVTLPIIYPSIEPPMQQPQKKKSRRLESYNDEFENFWKLYPKKIDKSDAHKAYIKAIKTGASHDHLASRAESFSKYNERAATEQKYIPAAATWINKKRWENDYDSMQVGSTKLGKPQQQKFQATDIRDLLEQGIL